MIGRHGLTCEEFESWFEHAIQAGKPTNDEQIGGGDNDDDDIATCQTKIVHRVTKYMSEKSRLASQASGDIVFIKTSDSELAEKNFN
jgi:hypothetical protein